MSKYFLKNLIWNENTKNTTGLPRPYTDVPKSFWRLKNKSFYLHKKIPIPWQSIPIFDKKMTVLNVIQENEKKIYEENLCPYCGVVINSNEISIRWKEHKGIPNNLGPRVFSDLHPFHIECMEQARIFCPFMRKTKDSEFEYGEYVILRNNTDSWILDNIGGQAMNHEHVQIIENFISDEDCDSIIRHMESKKDSKFWISNNLRKMIVNDSSDEIKPIVLKYFNKIKDLVNDHELYITEYMLSQYKAGFYMKPAHIDTESGKDHFYLSAVFYLNNDFAGGAIEFPKIGLKHMPKKGDVAIFLSASEHTEHLVEVVTKGTRYAMPLWMTKNKDMELDFLR
jgi:hypothetical protein